MPFFPTNLYPRAFWTGSLSVDAALPIGAAPPAFNVNKVENYAASGLRETIVIRREETRNLGFQAVEALETAEWRSFMDYAISGNQFEFLLDRFTGPVVTFANTIKDQDLAGVASMTSVPSYQVATGQRGLIAVPGSFSLLALTNVGSENHTLTHSQGTFVLSAVCSFTPAGEQRTLFDVRCANAAANGFLLDVQSGMVRWTGYTSTGSQWTRAISMAWPAGAAVTFFGQWLATKSMNLLVAVQGSATITATFDLVGSAGVPGSFTTLANTLALFNRIATTAGSLAGVLLMAGFFRAAYDDPTALASHFPIGRNYYSKCELLNAVAFTPARQNPGVDQWDFAMMIRQSPV